MTVDSVFDNGGARSERISLSLVIAMYRVESYLAEFLDSLAAQDTTGFDVEYVFVDDGSPQDEARLTRDWLATTGFSGRVLQKENGGVSSARNHGLEHATGDLVSFPDPDDILAPGYLREIAEYAMTPGGARADVISARIVFYFEESGETKDTHPLKFKFESTPKNLSLRRLPHVIQVHTSTGFMRRKALMDAGLRFDETLSLGEDAVFLGRLFATVDFPVVGVVPGAVYLYRKRATRDSALDVGSPQGLVDRLVVGYVPLIRDLAAAGRLHEWAAHLALYDLGWLYKQELSMTPRSASMTPQQRAAVLDGTRELLALMPEEWIFTSLRPAIPEVIRLLWMTLRAEALGEPHLDPIGGAVQVAALDDDRKLLQLKYLFTGDVPDESVLIGGLRSEPVAAKTRTIEFFGQRVLFERILWVPATSSLRVLLGGRLQPLQYSGPAPVYSLLRAEIWKHFRRPFPRVAAQAVREPSARSSPKPAAPQRLSKPRRAVARSAARLRRRARPVWIFMDRVDMAQDNAEHLYRHVRSTLPGVDAWFVLERGSHDWDRLHREGFKLAAFRSDRHLALLLVADHVISSHADIEMTDPVPTSFYPNGRRPWKFTFLQHGITKDDLSRWLNRKPISTFVTATRDEYESIAGERTPYLVTSKEVVLSGFPRHDALLSKARRRDEDGIRYVVVAPTWRDGLLAPKQPFEPRRLIDGFDDSLYATSWRALLNSEALRAAIAESGREFVFLPHPTMQQFAEHFSVPAGIRTVRYSDGDIQELLARTDLMITDYSSLAFEVAFVGAPTVYFQFDAKGIYSGQHTYTPGYFDYEKDGFGPVSDTVESVVGAARMLLTAQQQGGAYRERIEALFPNRDGRASERVVRAIVASRPDRGVGGAPGSLPRRVRNVIRRTARRVRRRWGRRPQG